MASPSYLDDEEKNLVPDFRSRYAAETSGMPADLAAIASRNLAAQDVALTRVNAASRIAAQSAPPSEPLAPISFDTPQSAVRDPQSLSDLHTDDIATRRAAIEDQKKLIQVRLGILPPKEAGLAAVVLANPHERKDLLGNLAVLEHESDNLLREHQINSVAAARAAHENFVRQKHIDTATEFSQMVDHLQDVRKTTKRGTPERADALFETARKFPAAFSAQAGQTLFRQLANEHDAAAVLNPPPGYEKIPSSMSEDGKVHYKVAPEGTADLERTEEALKSKYGLALKDIKAPGNIESGNVNAEGKFVNANKGTHFRVSTKEGEFIIPRAEFESFGGHISEADKISSSESSPAGGPATDLKALAQKAINDPNASEAHKAAARKLLGQ